MIYKVLQEMQDLRVRYWSSERTAGAVWVSIIEEAISPPIPQRIAGGLKNSTPIAIWLIDAAVPKVVIHLSIFSLKIGFVGLMSILYAIRPPMHPKIVGKGVMLTAMMRGKALMAAETIRAAVGGRILSVRTSIFLPRERAPISAVVMACCVFSQTVSKAAGMVVVKNLDTSEHIVLTPG